MNNSQLEMELATAVRQVWKDQGVEFLVGALSSIATPNQLRVLIDEVKQSGQHFPSLS